jgi:UDP-N-acetylmuramoyl-tripeptide--D-alanyl-D-alanine ligase
LEEILIGLSLQKVAQILKVSGHFPGSVSQYVIDSRKVVPKALFFAIRGNRVDGHHFLKDVAEKKALAAVVDASYQGNCYGLPLIRTTSAEKALSYLTSKLLEKEAPSILAITGSVGKTTTKEFVRQILTDDFVHTSEGNRNTPIGLSLSLLNREKKSSTVICEMGIGRPNDMDELVVLAPPDIAMITWIALVHSLYFPRGIEAILEEKMKIFSHPKTRVKIMPYEFAPQGKGYVTFSLRHKQADYFLTKEKNGYRIQTKDEKTEPFTLPFSAPNLLHNFLAAATFCRESGALWERIITRGSKLRVPSMRFEKIEKKGLTFINDAYNASPYSMEKAFEEINQMKAKGKKIAILGAMEELGSFSDKQHQNIAKKALDTFDLIVSIGEAWHALKSRNNQRWIFSSSIEDIVKSLQKYRQTDDLILIKGSRTYQLEIILNYF